LLVVMAVIYVRWFLRGGSPASVAAGVVAISTPAPAPTGRVEGDTPALSMERARSSLGSAPAERGPFELQSDPFALHLERFPRLPSSGGPAASMPAGPASPAAPPAAGAGDAIEAAARTLVLQSTVSGSSPLACINGECLRRGQQING